MDSEIDRLLDEAQLNIKQQQKNENKQLNIVEEIANSIPKLQSEIEKRAQTTKTPHKDIPLKSINKPQSKPDNAGKDWFGLKRPEITPELKRDLQILNMRHVIDPKRFYKKSDTLSKYFAVGTIKEDPTEFFSARLTHKERQNTLAEEVLSTRGDYFKSKYRDIQKSKTSGGKKSWRKRREMRA